MAAFPGRSPRGAHGQGVSRLAGTGLVTHGARLGSWHSSSWVFTGRFCNAFDGLHCIGVDVWDSPFG